MGKVLHHIDFFVCKSFKNSVFFSPFLFGCFSLYIYLHAEFCLKCARSNNATRNGIYVYVICSMNCILKKKIKKTNFSSLFVWFRTRKVKFRNSYCLMKKNGYILTAKSLLVSRFHFSCVPYCNYI